MVWRFGRASRLATSNSSIAPRTEPSNSEGMSMARKDKSTDTDEGPVDVAKLREEVEIAELRARKMEASVRLSAARTALTGSRGERRKKKASAPGSAKQD